METMLSFLPEEQRQDVQSRLGPLFMDCLRRHTMGDSTSLRVEEAQAVLSALCFALRQTPQLLSGDLFAAYHQGQALLQEKGRQCQGLWQRVMETLPAARSEAMLSTLASIGSFFDHGDPTLPELPCAIDYPLMQPVPETLLGVDYLFQWLLQLRYENGVMGLFSTMQQEKILRRHCADYEQMPVNLCEPLLMAALGWQLLSPEKAPALALDQQQRARLADELQGKPVNQIQEALQSAVDSLCLQCRADEGMRTYLRCAALDAACCIASADRAGIESGVF